MRYSASIKQSGGFLSFILFFLYCANSLVVAQSGIQQEMLPQTYTLRQIETMLANFEEDLLTMDPLEGVDQISSLRKSCLALENEVDTSERNALTRAILKTYIFEMALNFYGENHSAAEVNALDVFRLDPGVSLSGNIATADLALWFEELREKTVGYLTITSRPEGGQVTIDGKLFGITPLENVFAPLGDHEIRVSRDGFTTWVGQISVTKGETETIHAEMRRKSASILVWTGPVGSRISVDSSVFVNQTQPLHFCMYPLAVFMGVNPQYISQPVFLDPVKPGERTLEFSSTCHRSQKFQINVGIGKFSVPPVALEQSEAFLNINSKVEGCKLYLDGNFLGQAPISSLRICPGHHVITAEFRVSGGWSHEFNIADRDELTLTATPRPTVLFLGCASENTSISIEGTFPIREWFSSSSYFNIVDFKTTNRYKFRPEVAAVLEKATLDEYDPNDREWIYLLDNLNAALLDTGADIISLARLVPGIASGNNQLLLFSNNSGQPDILEFNPGMPGTEIPESLKFALEEPLKLTRLRTGVRMTTFGDQVVISEVIPGGPAELSPLQAGDTVINVNGIPVNSRWDVEQILRNPETTTDCSLQVRRGNRGILSVLNTQRQPVTLPLRDPAIPYNIVFTRIASQINSGQNSPELYMNAAICLMNMNRNTMAMEYLSKCQLGNEGGIGLGTLGWLKHLCAPGQNEQFSPHLKLAKESQNDTIIHGDGPLLNDLFQ